MQFTPQQLAGAQRYGSKTRIGNWFEDLCTNDAKKKDLKFQAKASNAFEEKMRFCTQLVSSSVYGKSSIKIVL